MNTNIQLVPYQSGDEAGIDKLYVDVFGNSRPLRSWEWQFKRHPRGESWIILAKVSKEVVGHFAFRRNHINFVGTEVVAGQACDAMVRPDWQGGGLFTKLFLEGNKFVESKNLQVAFGFPNRLSFVADMRRLNRQRIANLQYYYLRIGYQRIAGKYCDRIIKLFLSGRNTICAYLEKQLTVDSGSIRTTTSLPVEAEEMLRECLNHEVLSLWKDLDYMRWRYEANPDHVYLYHLVTVNRRIEGLAVTRNCGGVIVICEFLHRTKDLRQSIALLRHIVQYYVKSAAQKIEFKGWDNGFFEYIFSKCGFSRSPSGIVFTAECFNNKKLDRMLSIPQNWTIVQGDMDVI